MKKTYSQDWTAYNKAQSKEKLLFMHLLRDLATYIDEKERKGKGRKPLNIQEMIFCLGLATYVSKSSRRVISDMAIAKSMGYITRSPHFNTIINYFNKPELTPVLHNLITLSALPLKQFEQHFAVDSSGFSTKMYAHWFEHKWKKNNRYREWRKAHVMSGARTNIITSIEVTKGTAADSPMFKPLVTHTSRYFNMKEVSGDMAYMSRKNFGVAAEAGAVPYIPFRKRTKKRSYGVPIWKDMYRLFHEHQEEFMAAYHKRSNAETVFAMMKRKFNTKLRCKNEVGQDNEILAIGLCHNICVLVQEFFELGAKIDFNICAEMLPAQKISYSC